ncbi:MAG: phosphoribosylformylglycinamidine synthase, partial [Clostridiales bacterium]|nr:phosphoribosylformylglycinamidine synthase [Clostridiales bacterium]
NTIVNISRDFLNTNGAFKRSGVSVPRKETMVLDNTKDLSVLVSDLSVCSQRGLGEIFDGSIGSASVIAPYGGTSRLSPSQTMVAKLPAYPKDTSTVSGMAFGFDAYLSDSNPFIGASCAVVESLSKLISSGFSLDNCYLTLQEYFERLGTDEERWGKPFSALLGAFEAQMKLCVAAIGGKDSMSGSFMDLDVPPTLVSFAVASANAYDIITNDFKNAGSYVYFIRAPYNADGTPDYEGIKSAWKNVSDLISAGRVLSSKALTSGGVAESIFKMAIGNSIGFESCDCDISFYDKNYGGIIIECAESCNIGTLIGKTTAEKIIKIERKAYKLDKLIEIWQGTLEGIFPTKADRHYDNITNISYDKRIVFARKDTFASPKAVIPVFPGTNCEYDTTCAVINAGGKAEIVMVRNLTQDFLTDSVKKMEEAIRSAQMIIIPGGFSSGDEPDGSGKFIASFFRNEYLTDAIHDLLYNRDGLILGICNGFQALIKLGLVPYGKIIPMDDTCPTLTFNSIGRHQARYIDTRVASVKSPWLSMCNVGDIHSVPVSHGEGRFAASPETLDELIANGQIAFQYVDPFGNASADIIYNPNGSVLAIEGITSPDGRVLGKMAHTERTGEYIAINIKGNKYQPIFESGVKYFK